MVAVPKFVSANARRGLDLLEFRGDGLRPATVREARQMAGGNVTADKVRRMAAWFARHEGDLDSPDANAYVAGERERPTAGQVAWLLWGGALGSDKLDAMRWAERKRDQLIEEGELSKAPASAIREGVTVQYAVPKPPDPTEYTTGIVESVTRTGTVTAGNQKLEATASDPVARIRVYAKVGDDEFQRTDRVVLQNASALRVVGSIEDKIKKQVSAEVEANLRRKMEDHNDKYGDSAGKRVTLAMLESVFNRGVGAYRTNPESVRPTVTSAEQWAYGRVNAFLTAVRTGRFPRTAFDTDLLPSGHPLSSRKDVEGKAMNELSKATKREDGEDFPAEAFAYVPDAEMPSTWKLRLWDSMDEKETAAQVGRAVAALGSGGFRGNQVEIPEADLAGVKSKVLAAWLATHPDMTREDAPAVIKGYGYEMKDDDGYGEEYGDGMIDPLDEMLDAYQGFVRMGEAELADATMELVHELQAFMLGTMKGDMTKGHDMGHSNPVACLSQVFVGLLAWPDSTELRTKVLALLDVASKKLFAQPEPGMPMMTGDDMEEGYGTVEEGGGSYGSGGRRRMRVRREIREEGGQFCVYSTTGRSFGCYSGRDQALERLAQIESFAAQLLEKASVAELIELHDRAHQLDVVTPAVKEAHDLIEDEIEGAFGLAQPYQLTEDQKLAMAESLGTGFVSKALEYRYTLGPAYVPNREDAHGEWADEETLQKAMWDWVRKGDRTIYLQHSDKPAGEMVELLTWPFVIEAELNVPNQGVTKYQFPANTPFLGVIWEPWAFDLVKDGQLRGYSIGGSAKRIEADLPLSATV